jgi:phospholipase/lecithinase/hemolysin
MHVGARFVAIFSSWLFSIVVVSGLLAPGSASADNDFHHHQFIKSIVVFGDSLSDSGNVFALNGGQIVAPPSYGMDGVDGLGIPEVVSLIPEAPYASRRFSNGRTWIELIANAIGLGSSVKPALPGALFDLDDGKASNYAFGSARANPVGQFPLGEQVSLFLSDIRGRARPNALYVIEIGGNDIRDAIGAVFLLLNGGEDPDVAMAAGVAVAQAAALSVKQAIETLHGAGARRFLVWNAPDVGSTPALQRLNALAVPGIAGVASFLSIAYNTALSTHLEDLEKLKHSEIVRFNVFEKLHAIQADPGRFGLADATTACIQPHVPPVFPSAPPFRCGQPDQHFFWDGIHPTRAGHRIIAFLAAKELLTELVLDD